MRKITLRRVGNSLGITLPRTVLEAYRLAEGDQLHLLETREGLLLTPFDPAFAEWAEAYERTNRRYRNALRALAR